jgi:uncharacterized membrane protein
MISPLWTLWNLSLAAAPVAAAYAMAWSARRPGWRRTRLAALGLVWLAFLPNSCYLLSEWRHFLYDDYFTVYRELAQPGTPSELGVIKHILFFAGYSGFGLACFVLAIRPVERSVLRLGGRPSVWAAPLFLATSLGVFMGLIVRLNSWDLATRPGYVLTVARHAALNPLLIGVVGAFAAFLGAVYIAAGIWLDGLALRLARTRAVRAGKPTGGSPWS